MSHQLSCYDCGRTYPFDQRTRCECGEPLWIDTDPSDFSGPVDQSGPGMWRYSYTLPVDTPVGIGVAAGGTPLIPVPNLDKYGGSTVFIKDESEQPSGSFKDRGSAVGISYAVEEDIKWVGALSSGNMAMSVAANAASADRKCVVILPDDTPDSRLRAIAQYEPTVVQVNDFMALNQKLAEFESELDIEFINAQVPLRIEGQKTIAYEICEEFVPDAIVLPVASGGHASAVWKGLQELQEAGRIGDVPRLYLVQTKAADPIAEAYRQGKDTVSPTSVGDSIAFSILNTDPLSGNRALTAARETGGGVLSVSESAMKEARSRIASSAGLCVEPSAAVPLAGLRSLADRGEVESIEDVVLITTGTGFKELGLLEVDIEPKSIDVGDAYDTLAGLVE